MSNDKDLVAVMLPRVTVIATAEARRELVNIIQDEFKVACKKALRPKPPSEMDMGDLGCGDVAPERGKRVARWIRWVLENGWEVEVGE